MDFWLVEGVGGDGLCDWVCFGGFVILPGNEPSGRAGEGAGLAGASPFPIDVFTRVSLFNPIRGGFWQSVRARWELEPVRLKGFPCTDIREFRVLAERFAKSDPYIVTDDDVLIVGKDWVKRGVEAMLANPEYAVCSSLSLVEGENLAKGQGVIYDMHAVGAPMWIRKGILTDLPEMTLDQECGIIHKYVLDKGYKEGLINGLRHNHLGHGFSSNPALHWGF